MIKKCLVKDIDKRYSASDALNHNWILTRGNDISKSGTIGDGVSNQVYEGIDEIMKTNVQVKNAAMTYFSQRLDKNNFEGLSKMLKDTDPNESGFLANDEFKRCISKADMKVTDRELESLVEELDKE